MSKDDLVWILNITYPTLKIMFLDNLGNLNIEWEIDDRKKLLSILFGVIMVLWLRKKISLFEMHAEVFENKLTYV